MSPATNFAWRFKGSGMANSVDTDQPAPSGFTPHPHLPRATEKKNVNIFFKKIQISLFFSPLNNIL